MQLFGGEHHNRIESALHRDEGLRDSGMELRAGVPLDLHQRGLG